MERARRTAWNDGRNWVNAAGSAYIQATYPGSSAVAGADEVIFDAALGSTDGAPAGYTLTTALAKLSVLPAYNQGIASALAPLVINADAILIQATTAKDLYINTNTGGFDKATVLDGKLTGVLEIGDLVALKGKLTLLSGSDVSNSLLVGYVTSQTGDMQVTIEDGCTLPSEVKQYGGRVSCQSPVTLYTGTGGNWSQDAGAFTNLVMYAGAVLWNGTGKITEAYVYGGTFDCSGAQSARRIGKLHVFSGANVSLNSGTETVLIDEYIDCEGGAIDFPVGAKIGRALADTSSVPQGIEPQSVTNGATVTGTGFQVGPEDSIIGFAMVGAGGAAGGSVVFTLYPAAANTFASESSVASVTPASEHSAGIFAIQATDLAGKYWLRVKVANTLVGGVPAFAACQVNVKKPQ